MKTASSESTSARLLRTVGPPLLLLIVFLGFWQFCVWWFDLKPFLVPGPLRVASAAVASFGKLAAATRVSAAAALSGFAASLVTGVVIAFFFSQSRLIRVSCYPYAIFLQTVPIVAIAPLIINWFGFGFRSTVIISFIISLFPIITSTTTGMTSVDPELLDLFRLNQASRWQIWLKLRLPNAVPHLITGARTSSGLSVVGALVGEYFAGFGVNDYGLGFLIGRNTSQMRTDELFAAVIASTLLGITIFGTVSMAGAFVLNRWYNSR
ncbi:MAG: ABC transporter permease [Planctomycetota bacterium]|nr:ABC transporter permease [Planctomycetota bacterium]MDA1162470.1 ABC transporter permease [Planctomycetota bacterium]